MSKLSDLTDYVSHTDIKEHHKPLFSSMGKDIPAGIVVFLVALPLCLGIALASGAPLLSGLISGVIGGLVIGYLSGSATSVSGPAASVSAVVLLSIQELGAFDVFLLALVIGGIFQFFLGLLKTGLIADYMPTNIIKGLLSAIGVILILSQIPYIFGLSQADLVQSGAFGSFLRGVVASVSPGALIISAISLFILLGWKLVAVKIVKFLPPSLLVVVVGVVLNLIFEYFVPALRLAPEHLVNIPKVESIGTFFIFPDFSAIGNYEVWKTGITITIIASLATLLNLEATDNIDPLKRKSPPNKELIAQGIGNTLAGFIGGIPITSVIVRSSVNIDSGAQTKLSTLVHGMLLLLSVLFLSPLINLIPLASLATILLITGYKLASIALFKSMYKKGWDQFIPFTVTVVAIIVTDLLTGILIGSAISIFFLLKSNYNNPFFVENLRFYSGETVRLELSNEVSFLNKAAIKNTLWSLPNGSRVEIDATYSSFIDHDVLEIIDDFKNSYAVQNNIDVSLIGMKEKYLANDSFDFESGKVEVVFKQNTPDQILNILLGGNHIYVKSKLAFRRLTHQQNSAVMGKPPMAVILACVDLRNSPEMIFNTGIGELIMINSAGYTLGAETIESIEAACHISGVKLILVLGNTQNTVVQHELEEISNPNSSSRLQSHILSLAESHGIKVPDLDPNSPEVVDQVTRWSVDQAAQTLHSQSAFIREHVSKGSLGLQKALYDKVTGKVTLLPKE